MKKPINAKIHGISDYVMSAVTSVLPLVLPMNSTARRSMQIMGSGMALNSALTDTPVGVKPVMSFKTHKWVDVGLLAGSALLTLMGSIRKDRAALTFHLAVVALSLGTFLLTDFRSRG